MWEHFPSVSLNSQMKSFTGTANMMPTRPPGGKGGAEQHRPHLRKRAGHMGRNLSRAKSLDKGLATGHDWPSFSSLLRLLVSLLCTVLCVFFHFSASKMGKVLIQSGSIIYYFLSSPRLHTFLYYNESLT